jgi:hypothetical protein
MFSLACMLCSLPIEKVMKKKALQTRVFNKYNTNGKERRSKRLIDDYPPT